MNVAGLSVTVPASIPNVLATQPKRIEPDDSMVYDDTNTWKNTQVITKDGQVMAAYDDAPAEARAAYDVAEADATQAWNAYDAAAREPGGAGEPAAWEAYWAALCELQKAAAALFSQPHDDATVTGAVQQ